MQMFGFRGKTVKNYVPGRNSHNYALTLIIKNKKLNGGKCISNV